jgi:Tol biopolymer transport system component/DNA-binding winged helix-turn-helix (wHTH) protein
VALEVSRFGNFEVDLRSRELTRAGARVRLQDQPFQLLVVLLERPGEVITREELRQRLWPTDTFVQFDDGLNVAVRKVRRALGDSAESPRFVETVPRLGYRFLAEVRWLDPTAPVAEEGARASAARESAATGDPQPWVARGGGVRVAYGLIPLLAGALAWWWVASPKPPASSGLRPLTNLPGFEEHSPSFSPDGRLVAFMRTGPGEDYGIHLAQIDGGKVLRLTRALHDCCPDWSPDGRSIAFTRLSGDEPGIYVLPALGGAERRLHSQPPTLGWPRAHLAWSPDGKALAFTEPATGGADGSIALLSIANSTIRPLSSPPAGSVDWGPAYSPDGRTLAFIRSKAAFGVSELFVMPAEGGDARQLAQDDHRILTSPAWTADGRELLFDFARGGAPSLWRVPASGGEPRSAGIGGIALEPAVSPEGERMAFKAVSDTGAIWRLELGRGAPPAGSAPLYSAKGHIFSPRVSPDGSQIAFMGFEDIWLCDLDGSNAARLTSLRGGAGAPSWSPDGRTIAFDFPADGRREIWLIETSGGPPRLIRTVPGAENETPSWSADGRWIYFASRRAGEVPQVWKVPAIGGKSTPVTRDGGASPLEAADGFLYYARGYYGVEKRPGLWRIPIAGGTESRVNGVEPDERVNWTVTSKGLYYVALKAPLTERRLEFFDFATGTITDVSALDRDPLGLDVVPGGQAVVYSHVDFLSQIMVVEGFR